MARTKKSKAGGTGSVLGFEASLFLAADKLRKNMDAGEYKHVALGLIFLKYISDAFEARRGELVAAKAKGADPEDRDEYTSENVFWVPKSARWSFLQANAKQPTIGKLIDDAMVAIEKENPTLKGVLPKDYARQALDKSSLGGLIDLFAGIGLGDADARSKDILGRVYEYFLSEFASAEGKQSGQFYTPRSVVRVLVEMLAPYKGRVFDPCCGSGGMFVQSEKFVEAHGGRRGDISVYGQESNSTTWRLAKMNLAIRGIEANIAWNNEGSFLNDAHKDLKADYVLANPPFNDSDWSGDRLREDARWKYGVPPAGNANFAWVQHFLHHVAPNGTAGFILGSNSLSSSTGGEDMIRRNVVKAGLVDCIVTLPDFLFYSTSIPPSIWLLRRTVESETTTSRRAVLFIDASNLGRMLDRTHRDFTDSDVHTLASLYWSWRHNDHSYHDVPGLCRSVALDAVVANACNLLPAKYVHGEHVPTTCDADLRSAVLGEASKQTSVNFSVLAEQQERLDSALDKARLSIEAAATNIRFQTLTLSDILEPSVDRLGRASEPDILTCTERGGLMLQRERFAKRIATEDVSRYKVVRRGDVVYNPYLLWKGSIDQCWIVDIGITSPAYEVFKVRRGFDPTIVGRLVTSPEMIRRYAGISFGTVQRRRRAPPEQFLQMKVSVPVGDGLAAVSALLDTLQSCRVRARVAEIGVRRFIDDLCAQLR